MRKFASLLNFELSRFLKFLVPTLLITAVVQLYVTVSVSLEHNDMLERLAASGESLERVPPFTMEAVTGSGLYELSIMLVVLVFMFYSFFTWYREWFGKNTFIYRLLMLPTNRSYLLMTKVLVFIIGGLLAFVFQFGMYAIQLPITEWLVNPDHYTRLHIHNVQPMFVSIQNSLFPTTLFEFVSTYSFALAALLSLFAGILIERSFGMKGLVIGAGYFIGYFVLYVFLEVFLFNQLVTFPLRPSQIKITVLIYQMVMIVLGSIISSLLLKNKVKV